MANICHLDYHLFEFQKVEEVIKANKNFVLPENYSSVDEFCEDFKEQSHLDNISIGKPDDAFPIVDKMVEKFFSESKVKPEDVQYIVYVDQYFSTDEKASIPHGIAKKYNMEDAVVFNLHQGCGSSLTAMTLANKLLTEDDKYMIVLSACFVPNVELRYIVTTVVGDAVSMVVLNKSKGDIQLLADRTRSEGTMSLNYYNNINKELDAIAVIRVGIKTIKTMLKENNITIDDIDKMVPQSIHYNAYLNIYSNFLGIESEKIFLDNISKGGHLGDVDVIRNIKDYSDAEKNKTVLLYGLGGPVGKDKNFNALLLKIK